MRNYEKGEPIGRGGSKKVYETNNGIKRVIGEFHQTLSREQIKSAYYLAKISHLLYPKNIPDAEAAFNTKAGVSTLHLEKGFRDAHHIKSHRTSLELGKHAMERGYVPKEQTAEMQGYFESNQNKPEIVEFRQKAKNNGLNLDYGGQNFSRDPQGNILYLETNPAWEHRKDGSLLLYFDADKLSAAIELMQEPAKTQAKKYFDRLVSLMPKK